MALLEMVAKLGLGGTLRLAVAALLLSSAFMIPIPATFSQSDPDTGEESAGSAGSSSEDDQTGGSSDTSSSEENSGDSDSGGTEDSSADEPTGGEESGEPANDEGGEESSSDPEHGAPEDSGEEPAELSEPDSTGNQTSSDPVASNQTSAESDAGESSVGNQTSNANSGDNSISEDSAPEGNQTNTDSVLEEKIGTSENSYAETQVYVEIQEDGSGVLQLDEDTAEVEFDSGSIYFGDTIEQGGTLNMTVMEPEDFITSLPEEELEEMAILEEDGEFEVVVETGSGFTIEGQIVEIEFDNVTLAHERGVTIALEYDDAGLSEEQEQSIRILHFNHNTLVWEVLQNDDDSINGGQEVDAGNNIVYGTTYSFSHFVPGSEEGGPNPPTIDDPTSPTSDNTPIITGTKDAGTEVRLFDFVTDIFLGIAAADPSTTWSINTSVEIPDGLEDGLHVLYAVSANEGGTSTSNGTEIIIDTTAPPAPEIIFPIDNDVFDFSPDLEGTVATNFITQWGEFGTAGGDFDGPYDIAVSPDGESFIVDNGNDRVQYFIGSSFIFDWNGDDGEGPSEQFASPVSIAMDADGFIFVGDNVLQKIQKFGTFGDFITSWGESGSNSGQFMNPMGIAAWGSDETTIIYVADTGNHRIQKFDGIGNFTAKWGRNGGDGTAGSAAGEFDSPYGVAVDADGSVYVADTGNDRIQKFDSDGNFIMEWGSNGFGEGEFNFPRGVAVDIAGNVHVVDELNDRIQKFDSDGNFITEWGEFGTEEGQFNSPQKMAFDELGNAYVVDYGNNRIQTFEAVSGGPIITIFNGSTIIGTLSPAPLTGFWFITPDPELESGVYTVNATVTDAAGNTSPESNSVTFTISDTSATISGTKFIDEDGNGIWGEEGTVQGVEIRASSTIYNVTDSNDGGPEYDFIDISETGTEILSDNDFGVENVEIGFDFEYYGINYTRLNVETKGMMSFSDPVDDFVNEPLDESIYYNFIAPFWEDLITLDFQGGELISSGEIFYETQGEAGSKIFIVQWNELQHWKSSEQGVTLQAILFEGSNQILFQYRDVIFGEVFETDDEGETEYDNGLSATVGIKGPVDGFFTQYSHKEGVIDSELAILFTPETTEYGSGITDGDGFYSITGLPLETDILVYEVTPDDYMPTTPEYGITSVFFSEEEELNVDFGNMPTGTVSGHKFIDADGDGQWDLEFEDTMPDVVICAYSEATNDEICVTTSEQGFYSIEVPAGNVEVSEDEPDGYAQTAPEDFEEEGGVIALDGVYYLSLLQGETVENLDFGNALATGTIYGYKFEDTDGNEVWDEETEDPLDGVLISAFGPGYNVSDSNDESGPVYEFIDISNDESATEILHDEEGLVIVDADLGFNFTYFDEDYDAIGIAPVGMMFIGPGSISVFSDDLMTLDSEGAGSVFYKTIGDVGSRQFIVQWNDVQVYPSSPSNGTFQAILSESDGQIRFQYEDVDFGDIDHDNGAFAGVGIEGPNEIEFEYSHNEAVLNSNLTVAFVPADNALLGSDTTTSDGFYSIQLMPAGVEITITEQVPPGYAPTTPEGGSTVVTLTEEETKIDFGNRDAVSPDAPVISSPLDGAVIGDNLPLIEGTAEPLSTVEVFDDFDGDVVSLGTTETDECGCWELAVPVELADGVHVFTATATDESGNESPTSGETTMIVDTVGPISVEPATGMDPVDFALDEGELESIVAVEESALPDVESKPENVDFPFGFFSWTVTGLEQGGSINMTLTYPADVPAGSSYWKIIDDEWVDASSLLGSNDGDEIVTLIITDGGFGDADGLENGEVSDPGGIGEGSGNMTIRVVELNSDPEALLGGSEFTISPDPFTLESESSLVVADNGINDSDPADGIIKIVDVVFATYTLVETTTPAGYERITTSTTVSVHSGNPAPTVTVENRAEGQEIEEETELPPPQLDEEEIEEFEDRGATVNGEDVDSADDLPPALIAPPEDAGDLDPDDVIYSEEADPDATGSDLFDDFGIPTYPAPDESIADEVVYAPPAFVIPKEDGSNFVLTPIIEKIFENMTLLFLPPEETSVALASIQSVEMEFGEGGSNIGFSFDLSAEIPEDLPELEDIEEAALFLDVDFVGTVDFSDPDSFVSPPELVVLVSKQLEGETLPDGCPDITLYLLNENTDEWEEIDDPERNPDGDTANECSYIVHTEHFSKFAIGSVKGSISAVSSRGAGAGDSSRSVYVDGTFEEEYFTVNPLARVSVAQAAFLTVGGQQENEFAIGSTVQISTTIRNHQRDSQPYVFIVQVIDANGITQSLSWSGGILESAQTYTFSQSWLAEVPGNYQVRMFVWNGFDAPAPLSTVSARALQVSATGPTQSA